MMYSQSTQNGDYWDRDMNWSRVVGERTSKNGCRLNFVISMYAVTVLYPKPSRKYFGEMDTSKYQDLYQRITYTNLLEKYEPYGNIYDKTW